MKKESVIFPPLLDDFLTQFSLLNFRFCTFQLSPLISLFFVTPDIHYSIFLNIIYFNKNSFKV